MPDGRKWKVIPFLILFNEREVSSLPFDIRSHSTDVYSYFDDQDAFRWIKSAVDGYKAKVIASFDNLGFLVKYENGRFRLGPALSGKKDLESDFYNGEADLTRSYRTDLVTIDRDAYGVQFEVEQLECKRQSNPGVVLLS